MATGNQGIAGPAVKSPSLSPEARLVVITSLIGWSLANMDQSFFTWAYPSIQKEFNISLNQVSYLYTAIFIAGWLATFAVGPLMERFGRKPLFQATLIATALGSALSALSFNFSSLFAGRIVASAGSSSENFTSQVMTIESVPGARKGILVALAQTGYPIGWFLSAGISLLFLPVLGWRGLFLIGIIPALFIIYLRIATREPERSAEVLKLRKAARQEAATAHVNIEEAAEQVQTHYAVKKDEAVHSPLAQIFFKDMRGTTILLSVWFFITNVANAGATTYIPTIASLRGISASSVETIGVITTALAVGGYMACAWLGTQIGRRNAIAIFQGLGIVLGLIFAFFGKDLISFGVLYALWWFFAYGIYGCAITYIMESFPTRIRGMGSNFVGQFVWLGFLVYSLLAARILGAFGATAAVLFAMVGVAAIAFVVLLFNKNIPPRLELEEIAI
ncbi:MAG: MFS transporter [Ktedonobacteraceae bacterium]